jgi:hypothetical protein
MARRSFEPTPSCCPSPHSHCAFARCVVVSVYRCRRVWCVFPPHSQSGAHLTACRAVCAGQDFPEYAASPPCRPVPQLAHMFRVKSGCRCLQASTRASSHWSARKWSRRWATRLPAARNPPARTPTHSRPRVCADQGQGFFARVRDAAACRVLQLERGAPARATAASPSSRLLTWPCAWSRRRGAS